MKDEEKHPLYMVVINNGIYYVNWLNTERVVTRNVCQDIYCDYYCHPPPLVIYFIA